MQCRRLLNGIANNNRLCCILHICRSSDAGLGQILALELESVPKVCSSNHPSALIAQQGTMSFKSPTTILAQNLSGSLAIQSPQDAQTCTSFFGSTKKFHLTHDGLNSILDATPNSCFGVVAGMKRIRRPALREFYGSSVNSPNLDEGLRRSPRLAGQCTKIFEVPPPPPPIKNYTVTWVLVHTLLNDLHEFFQVQFFSTSVHIYTYIWLDILNPL